MQSKQRKGVEETILGPMLAPLDMLAEAGPGAAVLDAERALALRPCANLGCTNLAGPAEHDLPSQACSRCHVLRYCSRDCQLEAWPSHRRVCPFLQQPTRAAAA